MKKTLLITGGTGYIGSHAVVNFEQAGYTTVIIDNLSNSSRESLTWIEKILGYTPDFYKWDIGDRDFLRTLFEQYHFDWVIHFAWLKSVSESCEKPFLYHENNVSGSIALFEIMEAFSVKKIVFSSSATVYRADNISPLDESMATGTTNPYGTTKLVIEYLLRDLALQKSWNILALRYFNPIWAHPSGHIGEVPNGIPNNLLPYVLDVASGKRKQVSVFGDDYDTNDGTWVRDYIDIMDLVEAHLLAYEQLAPGFEVLNLGTGKGTSVLEMIDLVKEITKKDIPYTIVSRRAGDLGEVYCSPEKAHTMLSWKTKRSPRESIETAWKFVSRNR